MKSILDKNRFAIAVLLCMILNWGPSSANGISQEKTAIEQQVKLQMQDAAYGTAPGYKVSWVSSESKRVDSQRLKKEQPDIFNRYSKNVSSRRFTIIHAA